MKNFNRTVAYVRFSSDNQTENSIDAQKRAINLYAKNENISISEFYIDRAKSAKTALKRPEFMRMMNDAENGSFDNVIVHKLDRFSRNNVDTQIYLNKLRDHGISLTSVVEYFDESPQGKLIMQIMSSMNEFYSNNLALEVMKGMREKAYQCKYLGGTPPFGFDVNADKELTPNETESLAVKMIFGKFINGESYSEIQQWLNQNHYTTKMGRQFSKVSLHDILMNEKYKGTYVFNRVEKAKSDGKRNSHKYKPNDQVIRVENGIPAIVSAETWEKAQERLKQNKHNCGSLSAKNFYLLSGLIYCGECGAKMHGNSHPSSKKGTYPIGYRCNTRKNKGTCTNKEINGEFIDNYILTELEKFLCNNSIVKNVTQKINEMIDEQSKNSAVNIKQLERRLIELKNSQNNLINAIEKIGVSNDISDKIKGNELESTNIQSQLKYAQSNTPTPKKIDESQVMDSLKNIRKILKKRNLVMIRKFLKNFVESVYVYKDHVEINLKLCMRSDEGQISNEYRENKSAKMKDIALQTYNA